MHDQSTPAPTDSPASHPTGENPAATTAKIDDGPRIYVACLAAYNNGILHGRWISVTEPADIWEAVNAMLAASPVLDAEEYAIHDYEGFEGAAPSEWASFESVCALADFITEHGELGAKLYAHFGDCLDDAQTAMGNYCGDHKNLADFAEEIYSEPIPPSLDYYIDWQAMGRDMELSGDIFTIETGFEQVHIFWAH